MDSVIWVGTLQDKNATRKTWNKLSPANLEILPSCIKREERVFILKRKLKERIKLNINIVQNLTIEGPLSCVYHLLLHI